MDKKLILNRIKNKKNFKTDAELADFLGISRAVLSNWYKRNSIDYDLVLSKCEHMDYNYLIKGMIEDRTKSENDLILKRFEEIIAENALLKNELENLKEKYGINDGPVSYSLNKPLINIASEPAPK